MNTQSIRTLLEINALQTLGSVQTYSENAGNSSMFEQMLGEVMGQSVGNNTSSSVESLLGQLNPGFQSFDFSGMIDSAGANLEKKATSVAGSIGDIIKEAATRFDLPEKLIESVIKQESNFNPSAVSGAGASGLMQLMPGTARHLGVSNVFDPRDNVMGGAKYLRQMLDQFGGDIEKALAAYNAGPGNVKKYGGIPPFRETQNYVAKILKHFQA